MTTCPARALVGDDQGQPASKQAPRCWDCPLGLSGRVQSHVGGPLGGFCRLSATWKLLCTHPACHEITTSIHLSALHISYFTHTNTTLILHTIYTRSYQHLPAIRDTLSILSLIHRLPRQQLTSGRLHHFLPSQREPVPIRASARHTSPPPRIHLTATHSNTRQLACSLYVTA